MSQLAGSDSGRLGAAVPNRTRDRAIPRKLAAVIDEALIDDPRITVTTASDLATALRDAL